MLEKEKVFSAIAQLSQMTASPVIEKVIVYLVGHNGKTLAVNLKTGESLWQLPRGGQNTPLINGNALFLLDNQNHLLAINKKSGKLFWEISLENILWKGPFLIDGKLVLFSNGKTAIITPKDGSITLKENGIKVRYMHSDIDTLERIDIVSDLRKGEFDVLVGINLLREGLDLPEVKLVAIMDADKEGFLRSETALIQTIGRAARNSGGRVIMYADVMTGSMQRAIRETERRRKTQDAYNNAHGIVPKTIIKDINNSLEITKKVDNTKDIKLKDIPDEIEKLKALMKIASSSLDFEKCIEIRDTITKLKKKLRV